MVAPRRITIFTGTRAEYGLLRPLALRLQGFAEVELSWLVTGAHLSREHGYTVDEIDRDGFARQERVEILGLDDGDAAIAGAMARGIEGFAHALKRLKTDILVILGDRYEALAAATAATICRVPVAHIHGGELSFGAMDDVFRHAITKMSHLHFASTEAYRRRIIQMGEHPERVFHSGAPGVENALKLPLFSRAEVEARLGLSTGQPYVLATFHPATLEAASPAAQLAALIAVLRETTDAVAVFTGANADAHGRELNALLEAEATETPDRLRYFASLGSKMYLSAVRDAEFVIGNSSSGLIEVPSFGIPTVNIGSRQNGRTRADSVIDCATDAGSIAAAVARAQSEPFRAIAKSTVNPYGQPETSATIARVLAQHPLDGLITKGFYDLPLPAAQDGPYN